MINPNSYLFVNNVLFLLAGEAYRKTVNLVLQAVYGAYAARKSQNIVTWRLLEYLPINHKGLGFTEDILSEDL